MEPAMKRRLSFLAAALSVAVAALYLATPWWRAAIPHHGDFVPPPLAPPVPGLALQVFETGRMAIPGWTAHLGGGWRALVMDQPAFLIEHPVFGRALFEAGHHPEISRDPGAHLGWIHAAGLMPMSQDAGQDVRSQLAARGIDPDSVRHVIVSHFHPEHVGAVEELPAAAIVADRREIEHGLRSPDYNYVPREYDGVRAWRPLDLEGTAPFGPFPGSHDLFGDGSVIVVSTPGHTPGHISVLVNLPEGPVLLAGDVAWTEHNLQTASIGLPFVSHDGRAARVALGQLLRLSRERPDLLVVPGHDLRPLRRAARADVRVHAWRG
jgi:N-acyl homoserine lactone hydrolase